MKTTNQIYFNINKLRDFSCAFVDYVQATSQLCALSTGENHGLTYGQMFDKFLLTPEWRNIYPASWYNELENAKAEIKLLVANNNRLKDSITELELKTKVILPDPKNKKEIYGHD